MAAPGTDSNGPVDSFGAKTIWLTPQSVLHIMQSLAEGNMTSRGRVLALSACIFVSAGFFTGTAWCQATNSADVTGSVTDPSGAIVPGVVVTVRDLDKNTEKTILTNDSGLYDSGPLVPSDRYVIMFKKEGFATLQRGPMNLNAGVTGLNVEMTIGQSS